MSDKPLDKDLLPTLLAQNPSPVEKPSQDRREKVRTQVDRIMQVFLQMLPSNYVSQVTGPFYTLQFQAAAERIAEFQISAQEIMADAVYDYTRPEFLYQILGALVFPDATSDGYPTIDGDLTYRTFLKRMVELLLKGSTKESVTEGVKLLSDADFEVIERSIESRRLRGQSAWGLDDQFTFEINVSEGDGTEFPEDPFLLQENVRIVLRALRPAHTLYDYRHLFKESFGSLFDGSITWEWSNYYYEDYRRYWHGQKNITGTAGETWTDRTLFSDVTRDFSSVTAGAELVVTSGPNSTAASTEDAGWVGKFRVRDVLTFPVGTDTKARKYTTSPTGLSGKATVDVDAVVDEAQDWGQCVEGETLTFSEGPNKGTYRLKTLLGNNGGPVGKATGPATRVRVAPSLLRLETRMAVATTDQEYQVQVDRLGVQSPRAVSNEVVEAIELGGQTFYTKRGPLVKAWGDNTPATTADVTVTVDGVEVEVESVNPYTGQVVLADPVVLDARGNFTSVVLVTYHWLSQPIMRLAGLNTPGLTLNRFLPFQRRPGARATGQGPSGSEGSGQATVPGPSGSEGSGQATSLGGGGGGGGRRGDPFRSISDRNAGGYVTSRFPMGVVLGPGRARRKPLHIGHRYIGFERAYTATLNSPLSLRLNHSPHRARVPGAVKSYEPFVVDFDGTKAPTEAGWILTGSDDGGVDVNQGTYTVIDASQGDYDPANPKGVVYTRSSDMTAPSKVYVVSRFVVPKDEALFQTAAEKAAAGASRQNLSRTADGVFTGIGFGFHDNRRLYLVGALLVNGVEHVGLLTNALKPHLVTSWSIGPKVTLTILSKNTASALTADLPVDLVAWDRFQILTGDQAGVYTVTHLVHQSDGTTTLTVNSEFPADYKLWGNNYPSAYFETPWTGTPTTYRLTVDPDQKTAELRASGTTTALIATLDGVAPKYPQPADTSLMLSAKGKGQAFWGSLSHKAMSRSTWSFFRYGVVPDATSVHGYAVAVASEMEVVPEEDPKFEWFKTQGFGQSRVDASGSKVLLKSTSAHETLDFSFGYARIEPFLNPKSIVDVRAKFAVDSGVLGAGDAEIVIDDTAKEIRLATLLYTEGLLSGDYRQLLRLPAITAAGLLSPESLGWEPTSGSTLTTSHSGPDLVTTQDDEHRGGFLGSLDLGDAVLLDEGGRIMEAVFKVTSYTPNAAGDTGIRFGMDAGLAGTPRFVGVALMEVGGVPTLRLHTANQVPVADYTFDWADGEVHTYRLLVDEVGAVVALYVDDVLQAPTQAVGLFVGGSGESVCSFGCFGDDSSGSEDDDIAAEVEWRAVSYQMLAPSTAKRTLGVYLGGDKDLIDSWEIPRTDATSARNSEGTGPDIVEMDWRSNMEVRVLRDPRWGVTVFRPDMGLPPYYLGEDGTVGKGYTSEIVEPSAGWINVETANLPKKSSTFGQVMFGAFDSRAVTQQRWDRVRYRIQTYRDEDLTAPQGMTLNRYNVITSGERPRDTSLEQVAIQTLDQRRVTLRPTHLYAKAVYKVVDGDTIYTTNDYEFDYDSQTLTLLPDSDGEERLFSSEHAAVTVLFIPGKPVTSTYLMRQALLDGMTILNEGTPPVPKSQVGKATKTVVQGTKLNTEAGVADTDGDAAQDDPYKFVKWENQAGTLYDKLTFFEVTNEGETGLIASIGEEFQGIGLEGTQYWEGAFKPPYQGYAQKGGTDGGILFASGGSFTGPVLDGDILAGQVAPLGGVLNQGVLYPTGRTDPALAGRAHAMNPRHVNWHIRLKAVTPEVGEDEVLLSDEYSLAGADSTPPSLTEDEVVNPDGTPNANGSAIMTLDGVTFTV